jgi:toxin ParE1/3/4
VSESYGIRPRADRDLDEIANYYVDESGLDLGLRFLAAAEKTFELLASQPRIGWRCRLTHPALRTARVFFVEGFPKILVFYRPSPAPIEILRVLHGSRNLEAVFRGDRGIEGGG